MMKCPVTGAKLRNAGQDLVEFCNREAAEGRLTDRDGNLTRTPIESALVNEDGSLLYPVREGIAVLIAGQAIPVRSEIPDQPTVDT